MIQKLDNFTQIKSFVNENSNILQQMDGNCRTCPYKEKCRRQTKKDIIFWILKTKKQESRFPILLSVVHAVPIILKIVPAKVYIKMYGSCNSQLSCPFTAKEIMRNINKIENVYSMLTDEKSRKTYLHLIMHRMTLDSEYVKEVFDRTKQYFIDEYHNLGADEIYVDCGAYNGDTFFEYIKWNKMPRKSFLFEPDKYNMELLQKNIETLEDSSKIVCINKGLYNKNCSLWFHAKKNTGSSISEEKTNDSIPLEVVSLDDMIEDHVSFIKMDIEGAEKAAIEGARRIISSYAPKLAICIYHAIDDLWNIPILIKKIQPEYNHFIIRHYNDQFSETVLYAYK